MERRPLADGRLTLPQPPAQVSSRAGPPEGRSELAMTMKLTSRRHIRKFLLQPRIDLARKGPDAEHRIVVFQEAGLAHDQQMTEAADMVVEPLHLAVDLIGRAGEH